MADITKMTRDSLEHEVLQAQMKTISAQITANFDVVGEQLEHILTEAKRTNGRVRKLEQVTKLIDVMQENRKMAALVIYGLYNILQTASIENIIKWIKYFI